MADSANWELEWDADCLVYWGRYLEGRRCHWCPDFDGLPIDDTCSEMRWCTGERRDDEPDDDA